MVSKNEWAFVIGNVINNAISLRLTVLSLRSALCSDFGRGGDMDLDINQSLFSKREWAFVFHP
jgi:hypothetical protein